MLAVHRLIKNFTTSLSTVSRIRSNVGFKGQDLEGGGGVGDKTWLHIYIYFPLFVFMHITNFAPFTEAFSTYRLTKIMDLSGPCSWPTPPAINRAVVIYHDCFF